MNIQTNNIVISHAELGLLMLNIANIDFSILTYIEDIHDSIIKNKKIIPSLPIIGYTLTITIIKDVLL